LERQFKYEEELLAFEAEEIADRREAARDPSLALKRRLATIKKKAAPRPIDKIVTDIYQGLVVGQQLCQVDNLAKAYDGQALFQNLSFSVHRGERVAVVGANGCGKTTLLRVLTGSEPPDAGEVIWARGGDFVSYNQILDELDPHDTVTHAVNITGIAFAASRKKVNRFLTLLQFAEADQSQRIGTLSGGQRARVALAQCLLSGAAVIVLDEPTNHLDLTSTQVMERALLHFPGAVIVVSHDRFFVDKVATRLLVFQRESQPAHVDGNWTIWQARQAAAAGT
jgi:ATPase subunit of ABC transporter with duplicated ATPase domains